MTQTPQYPRYDPADVKKWLTKVFGESILFESQQSKKWNGGGSPTDLGAWHLSYTGEVVLQMDLPPLSAPHFARQFQESLNVAMGKTIEPDYWSKNRREVTETLRHSDWPLPSDIIRDNLWIDKGKLHVVAERLSAPADWTASIVKEMLAHEAAWIDRKQSVASLGNELFLGRDNQSGQTPQFGFRYDTTSGNRPGVELALVMSDYWPPFPENNYPETKTLVQRNHDLGLKGMLAYEYYCVGGHAADEEHKFALYGVSDTDIANKLEELRRPEKIAAVRQYIHEVIAATRIQNWFPDDQHPDLRTDQKNILAATPRDISKTERREWREKQMNALMAGPKYSLWREVFPQLVQGHPTTGEFVRAIHGKPPAGQEEVYKRLQRWADETFPLMKQHLEAEPAPVRSLDHTGKTINVPVAPAG